LSPSQGRGLEQITLSMRIVIVHFHLQTGGVTRVIEHACAALSAGGHRVLVAAGEPPDRPLPPDTALARIAGLGYEERRPAIGPDALAAELEDAARTHLGGRPDLWHVHNHSLGKNLALPGALSVLIRGGNRVLLQPHDFAEDGRPGLYARLLDALGGGDPARLSALLYPQAPHVHYAVLNDRDRGFLSAARVPAGRLHLLPNAVALAPPEHPGSHPFGRRRLWLYPTRAIRRKNLGELLLWSLTAGGDDLFAATQAPQNPQEMPRYARWKRLAEELALPVELEVGRRVSDFSGLVASAHALVTTSVAEGFGLAFLEPWLAGRPLAGRDLPEITRDFAAAGLDLSGLYGRLEVPLDWLDDAGLRTRLEAALRAVRGAYGRAERPEHMDRLWGHIVRDGRIDFGRLDEIAQEEVIRRLAASPADLARLRPSALTPPSDPKTIERNRVLVERDYSIAGYGRRLEAIYGALLDAPSTEPLETGDARALLDRFLAPERLCLLRT
jgi:glycosyltransferase involved in cell wall biosynthesis